MQPKDNLPARTTYDIAKGFFNVSNAIKYFEAIKGEDRVHHSAKRVLDGILKRLNWCLTDILSNMSPQSAKMMREQVCSWDTLDFEEAFDELVLMTPERRANAVVILRAYRKGDFEVQQVQEEVAHG
jgi:hypothetical protein